MNKRMLIANLKCGDQIKDPLRKGAILEVKSVIFRRGQVVLTFMDEDHDSFVVYKSMTATCTLVASCK